MVKRLVFVTGAGSGIGRALVREFVTHDYKVLAIDRSPELLKSLDKELALMGFASHTMQADVGDKEQFTTSLGAACQTMGPPEIFINCAGIARVEPFAESHLEDFENVLRANLNGVVYGTHFALSKMEPARGGMIVNVASMAGHVPAAFMTAYAASKFGVVGFTRALQAELKLSRSPVKICLVSPGFVDTPIMVQEKARFPWYMRWMVSTPTAAARAILRGIMRGQEEIYPDPGGRMMRRLYNLAPGLVVKSSRLLLAKSFSQLIGKEPIRL